MITEKWRRVLLPWCSPPWLAPPAPSTTALVRECIVASTDAAAGCPMSTHCRSGNRARVNLSTTRTAWPHAALHLLHLLHAPLHPVRCNFVWRFHMQTCAAVRRQLLPLADHTRVFVAGLTPPMGWRAWKAFYAHINQDIMEEMMVGCSVHLFELTSTPACASTCMRCLPLRSLRGLGLSRS
jgi:hypothetical protein